MQGRREPSFFAPAEESNTYWQGGREQQAVMSSHEAREEVVNKHNPC